MNQISQLLEKLADQGMQCHAVYAMLKDLVDVIVTCIVIGARHLMLVHRTSNIIVT